jgi:membrane-associated phospholipid phosphatase
LSYQPYFRIQRFEWARDCSALGSFQFAILACAFAALYHMGLAVRLACGLAGVEICGNAIKLMFYRPRPDGQPYRNLLERIDASTFPSIHAARAMMLASIAGGTWPLTLLLVIIAVLVGLSRMILQRHYLSDVLAGYALGFIIRYVVALLLGPVPGQFL